MPPQDVCDSGPSPPGAQAAGISFHQFGQLPNELQRTIWKEALVQPRIISFGENTAIPELTLACYASRDVGRSLYKPHQGCLHYATTSDWHTKIIRAYFDPERDTIHFTMVEDDAQPGSRLPPKFDNYSLGSLKALL